MLVNGELLVVIKVEIVRGIQNNISFVHSQAKFSAFFETMPSAHPFLVSYYHPFYTLPYTLPSFHFTVSLSLSFLAVSILPHKGDEGRRVGCKKFGPGGWLLAFCHLKISIVT